MGESGYPRFKRRKSPIKSHVITGFVRNPVFKMRKKGSQMPTSIFGINSNLDTGGIIDNLVALKRIPIDLIEAKRALEDAKLLSFQDLKDRLQTFKSMVTTFNTEAEFLSTKGSFFNNNGTDTNSVVKYG